MGFGPSNFGGGQGGGLVGNNQSPSMPMSQPMPPQQWGGGNMPGGAPYRGWGGNGPQMQNGGFGGWHSQGQNPAQPYVPQSYAAPPSPQQPAGTTPAMMGQPSPMPSSGMPAPMNQMAPNPGAMPPSPANPGQSPSFARGGMLQPNAGAPQGASPQLGHGLISSPVAGRTDRLPVNAKPDSYVIPADVVSGLGQGNTLAGERIWDAILQPYAEEAAKYPGNGSSANQHSVPIIVAGGEIAVDPAFVWAIGHGDTNAGHKTLDRMVVDIRKQVVKQIKSLPGPVK